jgi:hypothetical protein
MAKRFCDTNVWEEDWFVLLPPTYKLLWQWITAKCDHAGIWKANIESFKVFNGEVDLDKAMEYFNDSSKERLVKLPNGKYFLPGFYVFQYGSKLNLNNNMHRSVYEIYKENDVDIKFIKGLKEFVEKEIRPLGDLKETSQKGIDRAKDKDKDMYIIINKSEVENFEDALMEGFTIDQCSLDKDSKPYSVIETSIRLYNGFRISFPKNRDLPYVKRKDWIPPVRRLIEKKNYEPWQVIELAKWATEEGNFWRASTMDTISLERNFEKIKERYAGKVKT